MLMNTPYGAQRLPKAYSVVCSYAHTPAAVAAAIDVLTGKAQPTGSLPVTLEKTAGVSASDCREAVR